MIRDKVKGRVIGIKTNNITVSGKIIEETNDYITIKHKNGVTSVYKPKAKFVCGDVFAK